MTRRLPVVGSAVAGLMIVVAVLAASATKGGTVCSFSGDLPFEGLRLTPASAGQAGALSRDDALKRSQALFPGVELKDAQLSVISDPVIPLADGRLAWVLLRDEPIMLAHDVDGNVIKTTHICGVTVLDGKTGDLIFYADESIEQ